ncbi:MAG TPA: phosphonoacetate hydrolase [bacterium]|nr:phosphonoacetate hydrolase [bacterium]
MSLAERARGAGKAPVPVNGRVLRWPVLPVVVVCIDGCDPAYIAAARAAGVIPVIDRMTREGFAAIASAAMPTFTNPNNISIVCGAPPAIHGVSGNYYLERETGREVMMVDAQPLRAPTILARFSDAGAAVAVITAKDKLRLALGAGVTGVVFSAERAGSCTIAENGIDGVVELVGRSAPDPYSADLSLFVLDAGIRLLETRRPDLTYLSLSDYVQHKHAPGSPEANVFMGAVDERLGRLAACGARVGVVADHGMTDMALPDGRPNVLYLGDRLDAAFGAGATRVICPITDPFVRHHGALGGFVRVYLMRPGIERATVLRFIGALPAVECALSREDACARFDLPEDREADIAVVARRGCAIGSRVVEHDLTHLVGARLRSHGGVTEQPVPFIVSHPVTRDYAARANQGLRNFDIFEFALNGCGAHVPGVHLG